MTRCKLPVTEVLLQLIQTHTQGQIAALYGVTHQAVSYRLVQSRRPYTRHTDPVVYNARRRRRDLLDAIIQYKLTNDGCAPTIRELMALCAIPTTSVVLYHLRCLEREGTIERDGHIIRVTGARWVPPDPSGHTTIIVRPVSDTEDR